MSSEILVGISVVLVLAVVLGAWLSRRGKSAKPSSPEALESAPKPTLVSSERVTLDRPVGSVEELSLRELREVRGARLSEDYKSSEEARLAKDYRKGAQEAPLPSEASEDDVAPQDVPASSSRREEPAAATLSQGLERTRSGGFIGRLSKVFAGKEKLDAGMVEEIEEVLFTADIGASTSQLLLAKVEEAIASGDAGPDHVWAILRRECVAILAAGQGSWEIRDARPFVVLVVGVNGVGKTTTIGKLAARFQREGKRVMMVAGDTFRAAAVQQLEEWSKRVGCGFYRGTDEADPSGVIFDGIQQAREEGYDVVLADTAGRLHTKAPLVDELRKIARVAGKAMDGAPHETVLVLDSNTGQNAIQQARLFHEAVPLTGLVLTKLDGTAKGGIVLGITRELQLPVYYIGIGEGIRDLRPFQPSEFVDALF